MSSTIWVHPPSPPEQPAKRGQQARHRQHGQPPPNDLRWTLVIDGTEAERACELLHHALTGTPDGTPGRTSCYRAIGVSTLDEQQRGTDALDDITAMTTELVTNAAHHGRGRPIDLTLTISPSHITVTVAETATSATPTTGGHGDTADHTVGHRDHTVTDRLSTSWGLTRQHRTTATWFTLDHH